MKYIVESKGIQLPDGTVFGADRVEMLHVSYGLPGTFRVFEVQGKELIEKESGRNYRWREMRKIVSEFVNYQLSIGNRVFDDNGEIESFSLTEEKYF